MDDGRIAPFPPDSQDLAYLRLQHLADSALPIGGIAHSFGLETLTERSVVSVENLEDFLRAYIEEAGVLETAFLRAAHACARSGVASLRLDRWLDLNSRLSALKPARESRAASAALGQRLLLLALAMCDSPAIAGGIEAALDATRRSGGLVHHSVAFGWVAAGWDVAEDRCALGYLHQSVASLVSAAQRLLPLGQSQAARILWRLKPAMCEAAEKSRTTQPEEVCCFLPLLDWGAMEHPALRTRLFIS